MEMNSELRRVLRSSALRWLFGSHDENVLRRMKHIFPKNVSGVCFETMILVILRRDFIVERQSVNGYFFSNKHRLISTGSKSFRVRLAFDHCFYDLDDVYENLNSRQTLESSNFQSMHHELLVL